MMGERRGEKAKGRKGRTALASALSPLGFPLHEWWEGWGEGAAWGGDCQWQRCLRVLQS
jgi:hypothetical protein